ncbi:MAG: hypothetical protein KIT31_11465 [Deltaproteobacteria bacterium]|nr:hypothetical protein [Deltaproteobacteria bacterium]
MQRTTHPRRLLAVRFLLVATLASLASCGGSTLPPPPPAHRAGPPAKVRVVLYGTPDFTGDDTRLRFTALACAIEGKLVVGLPCAEAMPEKITVQIVGGKTIEAERTNVGYRDEPGDQTYPAPHGPECCSYNTCRGDSIPYLAAPGTAAPPLEPDEQGLVDHGGNHVVAIWPPDADVGLERHPPTNSGDAGPTGVVLDQLIRVRGAALASGRTRGSEGCRSCAVLYHQDGSAPWQPVGRPGPGHDGFVVMITTDLDGDGHPEAVVRELWRNGHGVTLLGNDWSTPSHDFRCGGI